MIVRTHLETLYQQGMDSHLGHGDPAICPTGFLHFPAFGDNLLHGCSIPKSSGLAHQLPH